MSKRERQDLVLKGKIEAVHRHSHEAYGSPRVHLRLRAEGVYVSRKRVERLMREMQLRGACRRQFITTTQRDPNVRPAPDLVNRQFTASAPNELWVADATYIPTWVGFLYLAIVLDVYSRRIVGWALENRDTTIHGVGRRLLRQRDGGIIFCDLGMRAVDETLLQNPCRSEHCHFRIPGRIL